MKRKAIIIGEEPQKESKGIEFTHYFNPKGWGEATIVPQDRQIVKIVYLGKCQTDGDMFAVYFNANTINVFKGNLNDGTY
jgi:hypothetical protein